MRARECVCVRAHACLQTVFWVSSWFTVLSQCCGKASWTPAHNKSETPKNINSGKEDPNFGIVFVFSGKYDTNTIFFLIKQIGSLSD